VDEKLPPADVVPVVPGREFCEPQFFARHAKVGFGAGSAQRSSRCDEHRKPALIFRQALDARFLDASADRGKLSKVGDRRCSVSRETPMLS